jgi:hypothetical protein
MYGVRNLDDDLKVLYGMGGGGDGNQVVFLFPHIQIKEDGFLEYVNSEG